MAKPVIRNAPYRRRPQRPNGWRLAAGLAGRLVGFGFLLMCGGFAWFLLDQPGPAPLAERTDAVVALTGGPGRTARGIAVLEAGAARRLLVSGVHPSVTVRAFVAASGIAPDSMECCVELGRAAETTRGNAAEVAAFVRAHGFGSVRLVTSAYHMRRAEAEVRAALPPGVRLVTDAVPAPVDGAALVTEFTKFLAARLLLSLGLAVPAPEMVGER